MTQRSLEVKLPTIWTDEVGRAREEKGRRKKSEKRNGQKKEEEKYAS